MSAERNPKIALYDYVHGKKRKAKEEVAINNVKVDCEEMGLNLHDATSRTMERKGWRASVDKLPLHANASLKQ